MANRYPPTPSFGGAFTSLPYSSLPPQQNGHNLFAGRPPVTSPMGALQSAGNVQSMNASHFATNAQISSPGLAMPTVPPHPFPQELFKQLVNSSLPPPPPPSFPPVPIPNLGFPPYQPPPNLPNSFTPPQTHNPGNFTGSASNVLQNLKESQPSFEKASVPIGSSREEGELSDGELEEASPADSSQTASQDEAFKMQMSLQQAYPNPETPGPSGPLLTSSTVVEKTTQAVQSLGHSSRHHSHEKATMGNVPQGQRKNIEEISPPSREDSGSSYDPPSVTTPDFTLDPSDARDEAAAQVYGKSPSQMRELAKGALLSLAPHGIRYPDLVREGVDPDLLQQLYEEIGIKDIRPEPPAGNYAHQTTQPPEPTALPAISEAYTNAKPTLSTDRPDSRSSSLPVALASNDAPSTQNDAPTPKAIDAPLQHTEQASRFPPGSPLATGAQNVAMERKDRIAQLLAAKTGRPAPVRTVSDAVTAPAPVSSNVPPTTVAEGIALASAQKAPTPNISDQPTPKSLKKKAQTELVRQKMESLKKETEAKARAQHQSQTPLPQKPDSFTGDAGITAPAPSLEQLLSTTPYQHSTVHSDRPSSQTRPASLDSPSFVKPPSQSNYVYRIPGLFMTSDEATNVEEHLATTAGRQADTPAPISLDLEQGLDQASRASSTSVPNTIHGSLTESNLAYLGNGSSTGRLPQKRPLASDSFDEPAPPTKRQFGRKDSVEHVENVESQVSDGEIDDGSDGIGMDIDEDSQASGLLISSSTPGKDASEQSTHTSPPITKLPEPRPVQVPTANSSVGMSTPTKEKDKEDLWRAKNLEIEAMRKRIAEMEQRRKAKQSQSRAKSPQASLAATPASPNFHSSSHSQASANPGSALPAVMSNPVYPQSNITATTTPPLIRADDHSSKNTPLSRSATEGPSQTGDLRKKMARRKELQDGLPSLDAEVRATQLKLAQTKARLAAIKREAEKREAEIREARQREAEVAAEALRLEEQLSMGLKGRSRFSEELQSLGAALEAVPENQIIYDDSLEPDFTAPGSEYVPPPIALPSASGTHTIPVGEPAATGGAVVDVETSSATVNEVIHQVNDRTKEDNEAAAPQSPIAEVVHSTSTSAPPAASPLNCQSFEEQNNESGSQCQTPTDPDLSQSSMGPRRVDEATVEASYTLAASSADPKGVMEEPEIDNDGSISMSDSGSEDYEPAEIPDVTQVSDLESDGYDPDDVRVSENMDHGKVSDLDDDYEPAEAVEPMDVGLPDIHLPAANNHHPSEVRDPDTADQRPSIPSSPKQIDKPPPSDDLETALELPGANTLTNPQDFQPQVEGGKEVDGVLREDPPPRTHFTPYESPLLFLKNFRFDPNFSARVAGGYNSLTYSNKIDPSRPVCPTEAEGGTCVDPKCEEQHFQQMVLPDDKILVEMSSARDFNQGDQRDQFHNGLKQVIAELRSKGVKEFPTVASALAAHRRTFAESVDPNRSLSL